MDDQVFHDAASIFAALGNESRLRILAALVNGPHTVLQLADHIGLTQPATSQHLKVLRDTNLVYAHKHGREQHYHIQDLHVQHIVEDALAHASGEGGGDAHSHSTTSPLQNCEE